MKQKMGKTKKARLTKKLIASRYSLMASAFLFALVGGGAYSLLLNDNSGPNTTKAEGVMTLYWSDEFDGNSLDTSRWQPYYNTYGDGNNEEACLTPDNITVSDGTLKITAKREAISCPGQPQDDFSSGFIGSRETGNYYPAHAKYEMRARLPHGQGLWPAFWLRHVNGSSTTEVDIMEYFHIQLPGRVSQTLHIPNEIRYNLSKDNTFFENPLSGTGGWHTFAVDMVPIDNGTKTRFDYYVNDVLTHTYTPASFNWLNNHNKEEMFDIAINMAVGGNWSGHPDDELGWSRYLNQCINEWPYGQSPCPDTGVVRADFPAVYEVDYVRVYVPEGGTPPPPPPPQTKLGNIQNFSATAGDGQVTLNWDAVTNADNYTVRWGQGGSWNNYSNDSGAGGNPTTNSFTITGLTNGQEYNFSVAARDSTGTHTNGDYAAAITATPQSSVSYSPGDINKDGTVDIVDLSILLSAWGTTNSQSDINSDGTVDIVDLSILLSNWD